MKIWQILAGKLKKYENLVNFEKDVIVTRRLKKYENLANFEMETEKV